MLFKRGVHALERRFRAFERGFTFMKIILSSYYREFTV